MYSQLLVVDLIRNWEVGRLGSNDSAIQLDLDYARLTLVTRDPEYYGNPEFEIRILNPRRRAIDEKWPSDESINQLCRSFQHHWGLKFLVCRHEGLTTSLEFKTTDKTQNHTGWDWVDVIAPKPEVI